MEPEKSKGSVDEDKPNGIVEDDKPKASVEVGKTNGIVQDFKVEDYSNQLEHARLGSYFLGPRGENFEFLKECFSSILEDQKRARQSLYPKDPDFITKEMIAAPTFQTSKYLLRKNLAEISQTLSTHSIPFWSPRYNAHMNMDTTLPGIVGYMTAMMYNPNNVATEASPYTTVIEKAVGIDHCKMIGIDTAENESGAYGWGHITCDGSVANLESIWAVRWAMEDGRPLHFLTSITPPWTITTCRGERKLFTNLNTWELLNLKPFTVLDIPYQLYKRYGVSGTFLQAALTSTLIQQIGKSALEKKFEVKDSKYLISTTKHYSWPKGGAITGIGSENFINVDVDDRVRMDIENLKTHLDKCLAEETAVYAVVAIIGSTEHGACDPIRDVLEVRSAYEKKGLSFVIHCDAAWGGYFAAMVMPERDLPSEDIIAFNMPDVPVRALNPYTTQQLRYLKYADSITIDPHKSGYINYPAGGLIYRDQRMRYLVTWTSPIVSHAAADNQSIGVFGVEGSKPGASAVATYLSHRTLQLTEKDGAGGYGRLLGEAVYSCSRLYCHWATMTTDTSDLIVTPLSLLTSERKKPSKFTDIEAEKTFIRERILVAENSDLQEDTEAFKLLRRLGGDLMINAFACNFRIDGKPNTDVSEANYLNTRIFERLSVNKMDDVVADRPLFLTSTTLEQKQYGDCLRTFKRRLELGEDASGDLAVLVNVTMSPWPTSSNFLSMLAREFRTIADEEVKNAIRRNKLEKTEHGFIMQGLDEVYLVHMPMFNMADHRWQVVITGTLPEDVRKLYRDRRSADWTKFYTIGNREKSLLSDLVTNGASFKARMDEGVPGPKTQPLAEFELTNVKIIINESMWPADLWPSYPEKMPFYLYGNSKECHIDHVLKKSPNAVLNSDCVTVQTTPSLTEAQLASGVVTVLSNVNESTMQPLPLDSKGQIIPFVPGLVFVPGMKYQVEIFENYADSQTHLKPAIATGQVTLGKSVFADWKDVNMVMDHEEDDDEDDNGHKDGDDHKN